jgi:hypothetical protein
LKQIIESLNKKVKEEETDNVWHYYLNEKNKKK